jgi:serine/threonine protein kinase
MDSKLVGETNTEVLVGDRFMLLSDEPRIGGMALVYKAMDKHSDDEFCALKRLTSGADDLLMRESFDREYRGLELAQHRSVVRLLDYGLDADHQPYIAMEWLESNLDDLITRSGPMTWTKFWRSIGKPILAAICWAQSKHLAHRDIKPKNVLLTDDGEPKLADFGISKSYQKDEPLHQNGRTFRHHGSPPYTPPEVDDGIHSYTRDSYSWVVMALSCLSGTLPQNLSDVRLLLTTIEDGPIDVLAKAVSDDPAERPRFAHLLLADIEQWLAARGTPTERPKLTCHVIFSDSCSFSLERSFGDEVTDPHAALLEDFATIARVRASSDGEDRIRIVGEQWVLHAQRQPMRPGRLLIEKAIKIGSAAGEKQRENTDETDLVLRNAIPVDTAVAEASIDEIFALAAHSEVARSEQRASERDRVYRLWQGYLRARSDFETGRASSLKYSDGTVNNNQVTVTLVSPPPPDLLGQDRLVNSNGTAIAMEVVAVLGDQVTMRVTFGDANRVPPHGVLEVNTRRALSAVEKQRRALDDLAYDRAINPELGEIVLNGKGARAPLSNVPWTKPRDKFDEDKVAVLRKALGVRDLMVVEGPPGTGKTRLIEEIIAQYLDANPRHRVLLSSQTHAALDNILERLAKRSKDVNLVRVGRIENDRIAPAAAEFLLERKAETWAAGVRKAARPWLAQRAAEKGLDADELRAGALAIKLALLIRDRQQAKQLEIAVEEAAKARAQAASDPDPSALTEEVKTRRLTEVALEEAVDIKDRLSSLLHDEDATRAELSALPGIANDLATSDDPDELEQYASLLVGDGEDGREHLRLMRLQEEWLERVGRSSDFHSAMLASAKVVASTCVALAGVRGVNEVAFDLCIVDEASKATATEVIIPMTRSRRTILVGDPQQLPPFFERDILNADSLAEYTEEEVRENVFDRLLRTLPTESKAKLLHQYRMARPIGDLVSEVFYGGELKSPLLKPEISFPMYPKLVTWLDTSRLTAGDPEKKVGTSWASPLECRVVKSQLAQLDFVARNRRKNYEVAVIAGYAAQVRSLEDAIRDYQATWANLTVRVNTVDAFQGSEADICIYSVVRSNDRGDAGFLSEPPRLNVALSRARSLLLIVGDHAFCTRLPTSHPMYDVVNYIERTPLDCEVRTLDDT